MITIGMNYDVIPGRENQFVNAFEAIANVLSNAAGHETSTLYRENGQENRFLILSQWSDEQSFHSFITSASFRKVVDWGSAQILIGSPTHTVYKK
jgi:heme-degrading monooxygenase HmoA